MGSFAVSSVFEFLSAKQHHVLFDLRYHTRSRFFRSHVNKLLPAYGVRNLPSLAEVVEVVGGRGVLDCILDLPSCLAR